MNSSMPRDIVAEIVAYHFDGDLAIRSTCKFIKEGVDLLIERLWNSLKATSPNGSIDIREYMINVEKNEKNKNYLFFFKTLYGNIKKDYNVKLAGKHVPTLDSQYRDLQNLHDKVIMAALWNGIHFGLLDLHIPYEKNTEEIKSFINNPVNFNKFECITFLGLQNLGLRVLPKEIDKLCSIHSLDLENNEFYQVPNLNGLKSLTCLTLSKNKLKEFVTGNFPSLKSLYLQKNQIKKIDFSLFSNIEKLYLDNNQLREIPSLESLKNLEELSIRNNQLKNIEGYLQLEKLITLQVDDNPWNEVPLLPPKSFKKRIIEKIDDSITTFNLLNTCSIS